MKKPLKILSTKLLTDSQKKTLSSFELEEKNLIEIALSKIGPLDKTIHCAVFTSQNAVKAVFEKNEVQPSVFRKVFCVGTKTADFLEKKGVVVSGICNSAYELAVLIAEEELKKNPNDQMKVTFFCGNIRREELPNLLRENQIDVEEVEVYQTTLVPKKMKKKYDGVLFFSPSAIQSYVSAGNSLETVAFCIGNTTAVAAIDAFEKVYVAAFPSVDAVTDLVVENLT
jgi:uroporphyrinogen-III synthase